MLSCEAFKLIAQSFLSSVMFLMGLRMICWKEFSSRMCYLKLLIYTKVLAFKKEAANFVAALLSHLEKS